MFHIKTYFNGNNVSNRKLFLKPHITYNNLQIIKKTQKTTTKKQQQQKTTTTTTKNKKNNKNYIP
jgi:hypothetical protein